MNIRTKNNNIRFICDAKDIAFFSAYLYKVWNLCEYYSVEWGYEDYD